MNDLTTEQIIMMLGAASYYAACVGWGCYIALQKNRSGNEGFLMGLTLGPFGVIAAACMPARDPLPRIKPASLSQSRHPEGGAPRYTDEEWAKRTPGKARKPSSN